MYLEGDKCTQTKYHNRHFHRSTSNYVNILRGKHSRNMRNYLNGHGCEDKQVCQIKSKRRYQKPKLVPLRSCCRLPWMKITKSCNGCGTANPYHWEVGREHLALKIPELVPWQIPKIDIGLKSSLPNMKYYTSLEDISVRTEVNIKS